MKKMIAMIVFLGLAGQAFAVNKCVNSAGSVSYQVAPCDINAKQSELEIKKQNDGTTETVIINDDNKNAKTDLVTLQEAVILQTKASGGMVIFTLQPKWKNGNLSKITIHYKIQFLDYSNVELGVDNRYKEMDANSISTTSQVLATFDNKPTDEFDYKKVSKAIISYSIDGDKSEKRLANVGIEKK